MEKTKKQLLLQIDELRIRADEAEDTLRALRRGEVDALVISGPDGEKVFTLKGAEQPYRFFVEAMNEGALTLTEGGAISYCNKRFAEMVRMPLQQVIGSSFYDLISPADQDMYQSIFEHGMAGGGKGEINLRVSPGEFLPVQLSISPLPLEEVTLACAVVTDISERKAAEEKINAYMQKLERSNRELQSFAFIASHDLQEPLRKLRVFGDLLAQKHGNSLSAEAKDYIARMQKAAERMGALLESLLDYSRITTKGQPFKEVDLREAADDAMSNLEIRIKETGGSIEVGDLPKIHGDRLQMIQLFQNLIANAIKFHREGEYPRVKIYSRFVENGSGGRGAYEIYVEDEGIGFDRKYADRIFLPFERLVRRGEFEGVGMGLAICKKIVERHGGTISVKSSPGKGASFILKIPPIGKEDTL